MVEQDLARAVVSLFPELTHRVARVLALLQMTLAVEGAPLGERRGERHSVCAHPCPSVVQVDAPEEGEDGDVPPIQGRLLMVHLAPTEAEHRQQHPQEQQTRSDRPPDSAGRRYQYGVCDCCRRGGGSDRRVRAADQCGGEVTRPTWHREPRTAVGETDRDCDVDIDQREQAHERGEPAEASDPGIHPLSSATKLEDGRLRKFHPPPEQ